MSTKKQIFLVGTVVGSFIGIFIFTMLFLSFSINGEFLPQRINKINYQVSIESGLGNAIKKASPNVVGVVRYRNDKESGTGSGVIYKLTDNLAYIITNNHVIDNGDKVEVAFQDGKRVIANVVGSDIITDLAVISIPKGDINSCITFSDSESLEVGDFVFAIGNPLGLKFYGSATLGIISSTERLIPIDIDKDGESDWFANVVQTDAAINPGNSGGALVNLDGRLIGINSMKMAGSQVEGLGFSIPSNIVHSVATDLELYGEVKRPYIGIHPISMKRLHSEDKMKLGLEYLNKGIYVNDVTPQSSASRAGLKVNDVIIKLNEQDIEDLTDFRLKLYKQKLGDEIRITYIRDNRSRVAVFHLEPKNKS